MKRVDVTWSASAQVDLDVIFDFLAEQSPVAATNIVQAILSRSRQIETFPESGTPFTSIRAQKTYRYLVEGNYKIIYSYYAGDKAFVLEIYDVRQNPEVLKI